LPRGAAKRQLHIASAEAPRTHRLLINKPSKKAIPPVVAIDPHGFSCT
jgi:hypothetical protein